MIKLLMTFLIPIFCFAQMRDANDVKISATLIELFKRECSHKQSLDQDKILDLQATYKALRADAQDDTKKQALVCYQDRLSQIQSTHLFYKELCTEVSKEGVQHTEEETLKILLMTQRYKKGILPFHDLLNDCLLEKGAKKYLIKTSVARAEGDILRRELNAIKPKRPFEPNQIESR